MTRDVVLAPEWGDGPDDNDGIATKIAGEYAGVTVTASLLVIAPRPPAANRATVRTFPAITHIRS